MRESRRAGVRFGHVKTRQHCTCHKCMTACQYRQKNLKAAPPNPPRNQRKEERIALTCYKKVSYRVKYTCKA